MARPRGFPRRSGTKRSTSWANGAAAADVAITATGKGLWTTGVVLSAALKVTIVRTRGLANILLTSATAAGDGFHGALGLALVPTTAFVAGSAAIPGPFTEEDWDGWLWHSYFDVRAITATIADGVNAALVSQRMEIDSKAMRIFDEDMTLVGMFEVVESGTAVAELHASTRLLVKLG